MRTATKMSNATARKYYMHSNDDDREGRPSCYFNQSGDDGGWGFWVSPAGEVTTDDVSASGEMPSAHIVAACVRAAKKHLA